MPLGFVVGGEASVNRAGVFPQPGRDKFSHQTLAVQHTFHLLGCFFDFRAGHFGQVGDSIVIVELHPIKAQLLVHF